MVLDSADQRAERAGLTEGTFLYFFEDFNEAWVEGVDTVSMCMPKILDVFGKVAEQKDVVFTNFAGYFDL
jgi:hypothetical protein